MREGILWGLAGLAVFFLNPALGMPPAIPGYAVIALEGRQGWWLFTVICTCLGLALIVFRAGLNAILLGLGLCLLPHIVGAPISSSTSPVPVEIKQAFFRATYLANAVFWITLGIVSAWMFQRTRR